MSQVAQWRPRITHPRPTVDPREAEDAATRFLTSLGLDLDQESMRETPRRMALAYAELLAVPEFEMTTFANDEEYDELVVVEDIPVRSLCEHHMLPFTGAATIGYLPNDRILGLSKFARLVEFYARRTQTQERLTKHVCDQLALHLRPRGVGVVIAAEHTCMSMRGAKAHGARTITSALVGDLRDNAALREEFLALTRGKGVR